MSEPAAPWRLDGTLALVTGASKGIGRAVVDVLLEHGARVIAIAREPASLHALGPDVIPVAGDLTEEPPLDRLVEEVSRHGPALDVLVNNAGRNIRKKTLAYTPDDFDALLDLNLRAAWRLTQALHPALSRSKQASVVNISSVAAKRAVLPSTAAYAASKGGLEALTRYLAAQWGPDGIRVNAVAPWYIRTPLAEPILRDEDKARAILDRTPLGRVGEPRDVANAVAFLASPAAGWISGVSLDVDGGFTALG